MRILNIIIHSIFAICLILIGYVFYLNKFDFIQKCILAYLMCACIIGLAINFKTK